MKKTIFALVAAAALNSVSAAPLVNGLGGAAGFGEHLLPANDDASSAAIDLSSLFPDGLDLFGSNYRSVFVNNNGNISLGQSMSVFDPNALLEQTGFPIIAPFFEDVDTEVGALVPSPGGNSTGSNQVYWDLDPTSSTFTVTWDDVGRYDNGTAPNAFQLSLQRVGQSDCDLEFRYEHISWSDKGGARAGLTAGDGIRIHEIETSGNRSAMLNLANDPGTILYKIRGGHVAHDVTFDPGTLGVHIGGGELQQLVAHGTSALAPHIESLEGWEHTGWSQPFSSVQSNLTISARYSPAYYPLTVHSGNGNGSYTNNTPITISAAPPPHGSVFSHWSTLPIELTNRLANADASTTTFNMPAGAVELTAHYAVLPTYTISTHSGPNGSISPTSATVIHGHNQTFSISPATGHHLETLLIDGNPVPVNASYTFNAVEANHTLEATFDINRYDVHFNLNNGTRSSGGLLHQQVAWNQSASEPIVTPPAGYVFDRWSHSLDAIRSDRMISAIYRQKASAWHTVRFNLGLHGSHVGGGALEQRIMHGHGAAAPLIQADEGWTFAGWSAPFSAVVGSLNLQARYVRHAGYKSLSLHSAFGDPSPGTGTSYHPNGTQITCTMSSMVISNASAIHTCIGWTASDGSSGSGSTATLQLDEDLELTWRWNSQYYLSLSTTGPGTLDAESGYYPAEQSLLIHALPDAGGNELRRWSGAASGMNPTVSILMNGPKTLHATFGAHTVESTINHLSPQRLILGGSVVFDGSAQASGGATILSNRWRMVELIDGIESGPTNFLAEGPSFIRDDLPEGHWKILFDAFDSTQTWSEPDTQEIRVANPAYLTDLAIERSDMRFYAEDGSELDPMMANQVLVDDRVRVEITVHNAGGVDIDMPVVVSLMDGKPPQNLEAYTPTEQLLGTNLISAIPAGGSATAVIDWYVGQNLDGNPINGYDGTFRMLSALAEQIENHDEAVDGDQQELPVYEASLLNNAGQATILVGEVPLEDYTMVATAYDQTRYANTYLYLQGKARYEWLDHEDEVLGASVQVRIGGRTYYGLTESPAGNFKVPIGYLAAGTYTAEVEVSDSTLSASTTATLTILPVPTGGGGGGSGGGTGGGTPEPTKPDLRVDAIITTGPGMYETESTMPHALAGSNVTLNATIRNTGNATAQQPFEVLFYADTTNAIIGTALIDVDLAPGASTTVTCPQLWTPAVAATYSICVRADSAHHVSEWSESNNERTLSVAVHDPLPDLRPYYIAGYVVQTLSIVPATPVQGEQLMLGVDIFNAGPVALPLSPFTVDFLINGSSVGTVDVVAALDSGESLHVDLPWDTSRVQPGFMNLEVRVDVHDEVTEDFEHNNQAATTFELLPATPALVIESLITNRDHYGNRVYVDDTVNLQARVRNKGGIPYTGGSNLELCVGDLGNLLGADPVSPLIVNQARTMDLTWQAPSTPGTYLLLLHLDGSIQSRTFYVLARSAPPPEPVPYADPGLHSSDISLLTTNWTRGDFVQAGAQVHNLGNMAATNVVAHFYYSVDTVGYTPLGISQPIGNMEPGATVSVASADLLEALEPYYTIKVRLTSTGDNKYSSNDAATRAFPVEAPWADAGDDQIGGVNNTITLDGTKSLYATAYDWRFTQRPFGSSAQLSGAGTVRPAFVPDLPGTYEVQLQVSDGAELYSPYAWVTITVLPPTSATLTIASNHGTPTPGIGNLTTTVGAQIDATVDDVFTNGTQWHCSGWSGTGIAPATGTTNSTSLLIVHETAQLTWNWSTNYLLETADNGYGRIEGPSGYLSAGETNALTAIGQKGFVLAGWDGDTEGCLSFNVYSDKGLYVPMDRPRSISARFQPVSAEHFQAIVTGTHTVDLSWSYSRLENATFRIDRQIGGETNWTTIATVSNTYTYTDRLANDGLSLMYRFIAIVDGLESRPKYDQAELLSIPEIAPITLEGRYGEPYKVALPTLLSFVTDPGGGALGVEWVDSLSSNGVALRTSGRWVYYEPAGLSPTHDAFSFSVTNSSGSSAVGIVNLHLIVDPATEQEALNISRISVVDQGLELRFVGIPERQYEVQTTETLGTAWSTLDSVIIGPMGYVDYLDTSFTNQNRFYRLYRGVTP